MRRAPAKRTISSVVRFDALKVWTRALSFAHLGTRRGPEVCSVFGHLRLGALAAPGPEGRLARSKREQPCPIPQLSYKLVRLDPRSAAVLDRTTRSNPAPPTFEPIAAQVALADEDHAIIDGERDHIHGRHALLRKLPLLGVRAHVQLCARGSRDSSAIRADTSERASSQNAP